MNPGPPPTFDARTRRTIAKAFTDGWTTYDLAAAYGVSQFLTWSIVDRLVPIDHPRRRGRRCRTSARSR